MRIMLRLSRSQQMALADILMTYMRLENQPQNFIDCSTGTTTTTGELLTLVTDLRELEAEPGEAVRLRPANYDKLPPDQ